MGTYATSTSIQTLLVDYPTFTAATLALVSKCIVQSETEVNKYLSKRYDITSLQTTVPPLLTSLTETHTEGLFWIRTSRGGKETIARGQLLIDLVHDNLDLLIEGKANLLDTAGSVIPIDSSSRPGVLENTSDYTSTFAEDSVLNWSVDTDKLNDIRSSRD